VLESVVIELSDRERAGEPANEELEPFDAYTRSPAGRLSRDPIRALLLQSGLWTALRTRPFGYVADPATQPHSIFVTAMDTNPLAADVNVVLAPREADFAEGLAAIAKLTDGKTYVCTRPETRVPTPTGVDTIQVEHFAGVHPAGTPPYSHARSGTPGQNGLVHQLSGRSGRRKAVCHGPAGRGAGGVAGGAGGA